jgi:hypothetical protein
MNRDAFLAAAREFKREPLRIDGIGDVFVREVSADEAKQYADRHAAQDKDDLDNAAWLAVRVLCDKDGNALLTDADIPAVRAMPMRILKAIGDKAQAVSGWGDEKNAASA